MGIEAVQRNIFCFDNEAFRLLACVLNGIKFEDDVMNIYEGSWKRACDETNRLLQHIIHETKPHVVRDTISLNDARRIIVGLSRPLQEFASTIKKNEREVKEALEEINALGSQAKSFQGKLEFEGITLEQHQLHKPRTVCTDSKCVEYVAVGKDMVKQPNYTRHCHPECNLGGSGGVDPEVIGDARLTGCWAMKSDNYCRHSNCGHHYSVHMHRTYDLHQVKKKFISDEVQRQLNTKLTEKGKVEAKKRDLEQLGKEFKTEGKIIQEVAAGFAAFLKIYAIIPFNDAMGEYIDAQIKQEKEKSDFDGKRAANIAEWTRYKAEYEQQRKILINAMDKVKNTDQGKSGAAKDIKDLMQKTFKLKHFGKDIEKVYHEIQKHKTQMPQYAQGPTRRLKQGSKINNIRPPGVMEKFWNQGKKFLGY